MSKKLRIIGMGLIIITLCGSIVFAGVKENIYSKLKCCDCSQDFVSCNCSHAKEMKAYIDALLDVELSEEQILRKISQKYGLDAIIDSKTRAKIKKQLAEKAGKNRPQISIEPLSKNIGKVSKSKGSVEVVVKIKNLGEETLKITNLKTSCACTTVKLITEKDQSASFGTKGAPSGWGADVVSNEEARLVIQLNLQHQHVHLGPMVRTVEITSNDPIYPVKKVKFEAEIVK